MIKTESRILPLKSLSNNNKRIKSLDKMMMIHYVGLENLFTL